MKWFSNESDHFPGEYYCYTLVSKDENSVVTVHDSIQSHKILSESYLSNREQNYLNRVLAQVSVGRSKEVLTTLTNNVY